MANDNSHAKTLEVFANAPVPKAVFTNVIPSIISMLMVIVYNLADTFFIGQTKDALMVAAVSLATPAFLLFMAVGMLFGIGGTSLISRRLGEGKKEDARHASSFCFWTGLIVGIVAMVSIWIFADPICRIVGADKETLEYTKQYLMIVAIGIPFLIVSNAFSNIIRSEGSPKTAMMGMIVGNLANIILDPVMILLLGWNVAGAAVATVIGNVLSTALYLHHILKKSTLLSINPKEYKAQGGIALGVFSIGVPASLNSILLSTSNIIVNNYMAVYGNMAVAGLGVAMKVNLIVVMLLIGIGVGIQPLLGYNYGARNKKRFKSILKFSLTLAFIVSAIMTAICYFGSSGLVKAFLDNQNAYNYGNEFVHILMLSGPILGFLFVLMNTIQSMGAAGPALILSVCRQGIAYIPVLILINKYTTDPKMLVFAQPTADLLATLLAVSLTVYAFKKTDWNTKQ